MKRAEQDEPEQENDSKTPQVWAREPSAPGEPACPPAEADEGQIIEEPGYGHGV